MTALRFFFMVTLARGGLTDRMPVVREPRELPIVLSPEEVAHFLEAAPGLKYRNGHNQQLLQRIECNVTFHTAMSTAYAQPAPATPGQVL